EPVTTHGHRAGVAARVDVDGVTVVALLVTVDHSVATIGGWIVAVAISFSVAISVALGFLVAIAVTFLGARRARHGGGRAHSTAAGGAVALRGRQLGDAAIGIRRDLAALARAGAIRALVAVEIAAGPVAVVVEAVVGVRGVGLGPAGEHDAAGEGDGQRDEADRGSGTD